MLLLVLVPRFAFGVGSACCLVSDSLFSCGKPFRNPGLHIPSFSPACNADDEHDEAGSLLLRPATDDDDTMMRRERNTGTNLGRERPFFD